jgi:transcriptional regulator with XRE-family HTH domain
MDDSQRVGNRIATARKSLGLTQNQLAGLAKVSKSMLAKVESGHATASTVWVGAVARALGVDVGYLVGQPYTNGSPDQSAIHRLIPGVRRALATWDEFPTDAPPESLEDLADDVRQLHVWRQDTDYLKIGSALPGVLSNLTIAAHQATSDEDRERAYALLTMAYRAANTIAHKLGYTDLSLTAVDRMRWAVARSGDPLLVAIIEYARSGPLSRMGEHDAAIRVLNRAIQSIEPAATNDVTARAILGCLHMRLIGFYGAAANSQMVDTHLAEATRIAATTGPDRLVYDTVFGPTNVALHALSAKVDLAEPGQALAVADGIHLPPDLAKERATYFYTDLARAHLLNGESDKAIDALYEARAVAASHFANSSVVRGTIYALGSQQRRANRSLRQLAQLVGIRD